MRILYVVNNAAFFCSHRLPLALAARAAGHEVALVTGQAGSPTLEADALQRLASLGIPHTATNFRSGGLHPLAEARGLLQLARAMRRWRPDLVHCASPKGLLYGGLAARLTGCPALVLAVSGMGSLFTGGGNARLVWLRRAYSAIVRIAYGHPHRRVIVQNSDDWALVSKAGLASEEDLRLIPGSGVPLGRYVDLPLEGRQPIVVLPARLLKDKGVEEFVEAARRIRQAGSPWRFVLVGTADYENPSAIPESRVRGWVDEGVVEWWGHRADMAEVLGQARIVCLPSYREGMPKALLEAAAAGCAVVTTDAIGCRDAIEPGLTGDLVPVADAAELATTLQRLIDDPARQRAYGEAGRSLARRRFDLEAVVQATLAIYGELRG